MSVDADVLMLLPGGAAISPKLPDVRGGSEVPKLRKVAWLAAKVLPR